MPTTNQEKFTAKLLALTLGAVTVLVFTQSVTDPVNVTKLFILGGLAFASLGAALAGKGSTHLKPHRLALVLIGLFLLASIVSLVASKAPLSQSVYGVYGRNNGFLLYILLILVFVSTLTIQNSNLFKYLLGALFFAGSVNVAYALWVMAFGDFIGWNNIYGNLLGTLGNPNFIGSFFGMFSALLFTYFFNPESSWKIRVASIGLLVLTFIGIIESNAVQGKVLFVAALGITLFFYIRSRVQFVVTDLSYIFLASVGFLLALFGTLQKGPLAGVLYKETVSLRGQYWHAGWTTGSQNPWFGAGFDSYGDWYRRSRRESALTLPGIDTVTNTAHNVYLDIFAFGGWPLLCGYIAINLLVIVTILRVTIKSRRFNPIFVSLTTVWVCYQLQSIISINQIGLAIWGWIFGAAIIAFGINEKNQTQKEQALSTGKQRNRAKNQNEPVFSPHLVAGLFSVLGLILSVPPLSADIKWRAAQVSQDVVKVEATLQGSYLNPHSTYRYINTVGVFESNGLFELAHKYALIAVEYNPESFESWRNLSLLKLATQAEKDIAFQNMKRLDPFNQTIGKIN
ncbi:O-antigen ligase-related [Candidatus Nanopelagicaceae bacterium]